MPERTSVPWSVDMSECAESERRSAESERAAAWRSLGLRVGVSRRELRRSPPLSPPRDGRSRALRVARTP